jgi:hypothetical protein
MLLMMLLLRLQHLFRTDDGHSHLLPSRDGPDPVREIADVLVPALRAQLVQGRLQSPQIVSVQAARPLAAVDVLGELLRVLRPDELLVVGRADVDERLDGPAVLGRQEGRVDVGGRVEGRVVDGVPVDLADVEVLFDFGDTVGRDAVGYAPDPLRGRVVVVGQLLPVGARDQGDDAPWGFGGAAMVLAGRGEGRLVGGLGWQGMGGWTRRRTSGWRHIGATGIRRWRAMTREG